MFQGVSQWLNSGVHLCVDVRVAGQCTRHNLHRTNNNNNNNDNNNNNNNNNNRNSHKITQVFLSA